jgi:biotin transport system substrate-specific component
MTGGSDMSATRLATRRPEAVLADAVPGTWMRDAVLVVGGVALMALLAQVAIPLPPSPVPITGQTLGVVLVGAALGSRRGVVSMGLYVLAGLVLPVYAEAGSGFRVIAGADGGYLIGFVLATWIIGRTAERGLDRRPLPAFAGFCLGQLAVFAIGVPWLKIATGIDWTVAIHEGFLVFILGGLVKAAVGAATVPSAWRLVRRVDGMRR